MKLINCQEHGEVKAVCTDWILLRYECPDCKLVKEKVDKDNNEEDNN
jgi:hypothetical protein